MSDHGYSGKPLAEKLGLKARMRAVVVRSPVGYLALLDREVALADRLPDTLHDFLHVFYDARAQLATDAEKLVDVLAPGGCLWISWPKKSSGYPTDLTEEDLRTILLPLGIVDTKVCAVDGTWSGLKFMHRTKKPSPR